MALLVGCYSLWYITLSETWLEGNIICGSQSLAFAFYLIRCYKAFLCSHRLFLFNFHYWSTCLCSCWGFQMPTYQLLFHLRTVDMASKRVFPVLPKCQTRAVFCFVCFFVQLNNLISKISEYLGSTPFHEISIPYIQLYNFVFFFVIALIS